MNSYWISAMFFPQGFNTAALQYFSRSTKIAIDTIVFKTTVYPHHVEEIKEPPAKGVNIHGLYVQGCKWNMETGALDDSDPKVLFV